MNQWVVYLDESGRFEGSAAAEEHPLVAGVMIPVGVDGTALEADVYRICRGHDALYRRGAEVASRRADLYRELFPMLVRHGVAFCLIRYQQDVLAGPHFAADSLGGNRYLAMVRRLLENLLFYNIENLKEPDAYAFQAASRMFPVSAADTGEQAILARLGFERVEGQKAEDGSLLFRLVRDGYLLGALQQAALDTGGKVPVNELASIQAVAVGSGGPLHMLADYLSNLLGQYLPPNGIFPAKAARRASLEESKNLKELALAVAGCARHRFLYGPLDDQYRGLFRRLRHGDAAGVIADWSAVEALAAHPYYAGPVQHLLEAASERLSGRPDAAGLALIEEAAWRFLLRRAGFQETARRILERLRTPLDRLAAVAPESCEHVRLRLRVQRDLLACANHQGRLDRAGEAIAAGESLRDPACRTPEGAALYLDFLNHQGVYLANMFRFREAQHLAEDSIRLREEEIGTLGRFFGVVPGRDQLLGELYGSLGQTLAFQAPLAPSGDLFARAETCFRRAMGLLERDWEVRVEQNFLTHLFLDRGRLPEAAGLVAALAGTDRPWPAPIEAAAEVGDPYTLALGWKTAWELRRSGGLTDEEASGLDRLAQRFSLEGALGDRASEHPAEFCAFYQALHAAEAKPAEGERLFQGIALVQPEAESVTLEWIRAAMVARWILIGVERKRAVSEVYFEEVQGRIRRALDAAPELRTQWRASQLGDTFEELLAAPPGPSALPALSAFATRFTFNYR